MDPNEYPGSPNRVDMPPKHDSQSTLYDYDDVPDPRKTYRSAASASNFNNPDPVYGPTEAVPAVPPENVLVPSPSQFEKLYLAPERAVAGKLRLTFANPTPVAIAGFLLCNTPACIDLMGWGGAGGGTGNVAAGVGTYYYLGAVLLYLGGIGEWILGNSFPAVVFLTFGGYWGSFGATLTPFFNAINSYDNDPKAFYDSFAMFLVSMAILCMIYTVAAIRTNIAAYFYHARGLMSLSASCRIAGAAFGFVSSIIAWYLFLALVLEGVDFPYVLPVGDLSRYIKGRSERAENPMV